MHYYFLMKKTLELVKIKQSLKNGNLCILPTDTILGIFADATNHIATHKIFSTKKRSDTKPLAIFLPSIKEINKYGIETDNSKEFVQTKLPGAFTVILRATDFAKHTLSPLLISSKGEVGIRIPMHNDILNIVKDIIVCGTSVNISGESFATNTIPKEIAQNIEYLFDGNSQIPSQSPSTIVDFTTLKPTIVR
ncbi:MAG: L-threonylcarbamoyladenylate synthase [Candidatus Deianiraeaceae bacterium]|jgi:L-threonylcarbamoyladenylate synthase